MWPGPSILAIIKSFKTERHYLKGYNYKISVYTDNNNLHLFIDIKNLSFRQIR